MKLNNGYKLTIIPPDAKSPMIGHKGGEIAVDEESKTMYAWEVFVRCYGLESITRACMSYK